MRKKIFKQTWAQKAVAVGLSAAMVIPSSVAYLGTTVTMAAELPTPVAVYEAGNTQDLDTTGKNKPDVVDAAELWDGGKAWSLKDSVAEEAPSASTTKSSDCSITVKNPFAGDKTLVEEVSVNKKNLPMWTTGVTITYWVKTPGDYDKTSSIISFTSEGLKTYDKDSMMKYRIASGYTEEKAKDPTTEYYSYQLSEKYNGKPVYDFYEYAKAKGIDVNDPFALSESKAIPQLICVSPNFPERAEEAYFYVGKHDASGKPSEALTDNNTLSLSNEYFLADGLSCPISYENYKSMDAPGMQYGYVNGLLQLHTDNTLFFGEDITRAKRYKNDGTETDDPGVMFPNYIQFYESSNDEASPEDDTNWYFVAFVIQNDYMYSVINGSDGQVVIDQTTNGINTGFFMGKSFNMGTGLLGSVGIGTAQHKVLEEDGRYYYSPNRNGKSIMEWLTAETTKLNIGGASLEIASAFGGTAEVGTTAGTQIACVKMYNEVLDEDTIAAIYEANDGHEKTEPTNPPGTDTPATETPGTDTPATETPGTETPATETPGTETPGTDTPATDTPATDTPATDTPATDAPGTDTPATDAPATDTPATDTPATDAPATDTPGTDTPATDTPFIYGDVDGNGRVDAQDALDVLKCVVQLKTFDDTQTKAGDVNCDDRISSQDALIILQYVVKILSELPVK